MAGNAGIGIVLRQGLDHGGRQRQIAVEIRIVKLIHRTGRRMLVVKQDGHGGFGDHAGQGGHRMIVVIDLLINLDFKIPVEFRERGIGDRKGDGLQHFVNAIVGKGDGALIDHVKVGIGRLQCPINRRRGDGIIGAWRGNQLFHSSSGSESSLMKLLTR